MLHLKPMSSVRLKVYDCKVLNAAKVIPDVSLKYGILRRNQCKDP